ncbi:MAG: N-acetylornithine carbamoyltransferase [Capnocytophaga sp.]|nr:N-acetylornithine carbamoyltransferase [Capnocytophaga sp.]
MKNLLRNRKLFEVIETAKSLKRNPYIFDYLGERKVLVMLFFNSSLRTRISTQKAAIHLGMDCIVMNFNSDSWQLEFEDGTVMDARTSEHIREAAATISQYCDILAVRAFPTLTDKEQDLSEKVFRSFEKYATVPVLNMESATAHPLQALADAMTISEYKNKLKHPKVVLTWAPHPNALPHAVANSFTEAMQLMPDIDFVITHPEGYELNPEVTKNSRIEYDQDKAFENADFIYAKNWSNFKEYGKVLNTDPSWMITAEKMKRTNNAKFMHCLPVRRNVIVEDAVLDSPQSIVIEQANNRTYATQAALKILLEDMI